MITQKDISHSINCFSTNPNDFQRQTPDISKEQWLQKYASRILMVWSQCQTPLGVTRDHLDKIKNDLISFYDDPMKRLLIETTY